MFPGQSGIHLTGQEEVDDIIKFARTIINQAVSISELHVASEYATFMTALHHIRISEESSHKVEYLTSEADIQDRISELRYAPNLKIFSLSACQYKDGAGKISGPDIFPAGTEPKPRSGAGIADLLRCQPNLRSLALIDIGLENIDEIVEALRGDHNLESLFLIKNALTNVDSLADLMRDNVSLVSISLIGNPIQDKEKVKYIKSRAAENKMASKNRKATLYDLILEQYKDEVYRE